MGLFGLVAAGLFADSLMSSSDGAEAETEEAESSDPPDTEGGAGDLTDYTDNDDDGTAIDPTPLRLDGTDGDDLVAAVAG